MAQLLQHRDGGPAHVRVVLDDQDGGGPVGPRHGGERVAFAGDGLDERGRNIDTGSRAPSSLRMEIDPPDCCTNVTWLNPRPVPLPTSLVVKNGS